MKSTKNKQPKLGSPIDLTLSLLFLYGSHGTPFFYHTKADFAATILTRVPGIRDTPRLQMPMLDTAYDIHGHLSILLQRSLPLWRHCIRKRQVSSHAANHHLPHNVIIVGIRIHILHSAQSRVCSMAMIERPDSLCNILGQLRHFEFLSEEIEIEKRADVFLFLWVAQCFGVEPTNEQFEGEVVGVWYAESLGGGALVFLVIEGTREEGRVMAEKPFVQDPMGGFLANVDVYQTSGEKPITKLVSV